MAVLTPGQIFTHARSAGFSLPEAVTATAIALAESGGRTDAVGDTTLTSAKWGPSIGLWQVRSLNAESGKGTSRDATRLTDPAFNARSAYAIFKGSNGWNNWSVYTNRKYLDKMTQAQAGAGNPGFIDGVSAGLTDTVVGGVASGADAVTGGAITKTDGVLDQLSGLLNNLSSGEWWKRIGIGAAGVLVILLALLVMVWAGKDKVLKSTVGTAVRSLK